MSKVSNYQEQRNLHPKTLHEQDDENLGREARRLVLSGVLPMALKAAVEIGLVDTLQEAAEDGGLYLSPSEIALRLPSIPRNPNAPDMLHRVLRLLASYSIVECHTIQTREKVESLYRAKPICRFLVKNGDEDGSLGPLLLLNNDIGNVSCWGHMKEAILEGGTAFNRTYGMSSFEYNEADQRIGGLFENAMSSFSKLLMLKLLRVYGGFRGLNVLIDVGGGTGATISLIIAKYPDIMAVNFDLHHVIANAPPQPGVKHVGGDMFVSIPKGDAIILKFVLHNWSDEDCLKILKNCWKALPEKGKVIVIQSVFLEDNSSDITALEDMVMLAFFGEGKERSKTELESLALNSGFAACELICSAYDCWVLEFHKNT